LALAQDKPDLVIIRKQSKIEFAGCEKGQPLIRGTIAAKNIGNGKATWLPTRLMLGIFVQEAPDVREEYRWLAALSPDEIQTREFAVGEKIQKTGRGLTNKLTLKVPTDKTVQRALTALGLYSGAIDGKLGSSSREAMAKYMEEQLGLKVDRRKFELTTEYKIRLVNESGIRQTAIEYDKKPDVISRPITVLVVIDPRNHVDEEDENNNIEKWELGQINCP
jgi:hypothetical protein